MKLLGIDYGTKRVGVAVSDDEGRLAFPLCVLANDGSLHQEVVDICQEYGVEKIVVGESLTLQGLDNPIMDEIRTFSKKTEANTNLDVVFEPEHMTTMQAARGQGRVKKIDASAAAIILQSYLDQHHERNDSV